MQGRFLVAAKEVAMGSNIYADKSSIILDWLLEMGIGKKSFSLRNVTHDRDVSIGLVQRVFEILVLHGLLHTIGVRTAKRFSLKKPEKLLKNWLEHYSIVKKCKMWTYQSAFQNKEELLKILNTSSLKEKTALALHSAAEAYGCKNTNLQTLELYLLDPTMKPELEKLLQLKPQERGYEVLFIEPYYKSLLKLGISSAHHTTNISPVLLTFLDLYISLSEGTNKQNLWQNVCLY